MRDVTRVRVLQAIGAAALGLGLAASAGAVTINGGLTGSAGGTLNTIEDQDREAFIDANNDGLVSVGDVLVGFVRIDNFLPSGQNANNQVYAVISNQITGFNGADQTQVILGVTTAVGLRLQDITGDANTAGGLVAVYDRGVPFSTNLINASAPGATNVKDDIDLILAEGTLRLVAGFVSADNYLHVDTIPGFGVGDSNSVLAITPTSVQIANYGGGMDIMYNNTNFAFTDSVITADPFTGALVQTPLGIANGALRGIVGDGNENVFATNGYGAFSQCDDGAGGTIRCGVVTDADFFVVAQVPEPGSLALLGVALLGLAGIRRRFVGA